MTKSDSLPDTSKIKTFSMRIEENFFHLLNSHINILKKLESRSHSKQRWIEDAIKEKLEIEESSQESIKESNYIKNLKSAILQKLKRYCFS